MALFWHTGGDSFPVRLSKLKYFGIGFVTLVAAFFFTMSRPLECHYKIVNKFTIGTVAYGCFVEYIPQTGIVDIDSIARCHSIEVMIDELYLSRINVGLKGTGTINNRAHELVITNIRPIAVDGRFGIEMNFCDEIPSSVVDGLSLRLRIELNEPSSEIMLPVGNYYKDTGGLWVFVVKNGTMAVRRDIKLGRKSGAEYFEVLEGLRPGEEVITSSYEKFIDVDTVDVMEMASLN